MNLRLLLIAAACVAALGLAWWVAPATPGVVAPPAAAIRAPVTPSITAGSAPPVTAPAPATDDTRRPSRQWALGDEQLLVVVRRGLGAQATALDSYLASQTLWQCQPWLRNAPVGPGENAKGVNVRAMHEAQAAMRRRCGALLQIPRSEIDARAADLDAAWQRPDQPFSDTANTLPRTADADQLARFKRTLRQNLEAGPDTLLWAHQALGDWLEHLAATGTGGPEALRQTPHKDAVVLLALCELGYPCDGESLVTLAVCASTGRCGGTLHAALLADIPAAQHSRTREDAALLARLLRSDPVVGLGLAD